MGGSYDCFIQPGQRKKVVAFFEKSGSYSGCKKIQNFQICLHGIGSMGAFWILNIAVH